MSRFLTLLQGRVFPPYCIGCGERISPCSPAGEAPYFCKKCEKKWESEQLSQCPVCYAAYCDCHCRPDVMHRAGVVGLVKLAPYHGEQGRAVVDRVIHGMKRTPRRRSFDCCARALAPLLLSALEKAEEKVPISHTVIGYLPRSRANVTRYGFDQARELAKALSARTGIPVARVLKRVRDGAPQKSLGVRKRQENLRGAFAPCGTVKGLRVILVDDLVTTGAGMAEAARVLRRSGAKDVLGVAVAVTPKKQGHGAG